MFRVILLPVAEIKFNLGSFAIEDNDALLVEPIQIDLFWQSGVVLWHDWLRLFWQSGGVVLWQSGVLLRVVAVRGGRVVAIISTPSIIPAAS